MIVRTLASILDTPAHVKGDAFESRRILLAGDGLGYSLHDTICKEGSVQLLDFLEENEKAVFKTAFELDQRWIIEHAADRTPFICQSQSVNVFLPANVHKRDLHQIHFLAWKKGMKSLYYCRSLSIARADTVSEKAIRPEIGRAHV